MTRCTMLFALALLAMGTAAAVGAPVLSGMRLLSESEYRHSVADSFGPGLAVEGRFQPPRRIDGLDAAASAILSITPAGFAAYAQMADAIAAQAVDARHRGALPCAPAAAGAADDACAGQVLAQYGLRLFRRPLTTEERAARIALAHQAADRTGDFYAGLRYGLASLLAAPDFLFRADYAVPDGQGGWTLDGYSRAARLSYLLWDTAPDGELLQAAGDGALMTPKGLARQVDRLMASPRLQDGMRAFFADFLELDTEAEKDTSVYPRYSAALAAAAREEALRSALDLALARKDDLRDLFTSRRTFLNRDLAALYGVPFRFDAEWVPYQFAPASGRSGLLTQAAFLSLFSHPNRSSPTRRGVALQEIFLCRTTPPPPATVDLTLFDGGEAALKTVRQRLVAHAANPACAACHRNSDPLGLALEHFDGIGAWRASDHGAPIDASASLEGKVFDGAPGLGRLLHDDPAFPACFVRKLTAYGTGGAAPFPDRAVLADFAAHGYRLPALLRALATSPSFFAAPAVKTALNAGAP